jgi:hypothetical protein
MTAVLARPLRAHTDLPAASVLAACRASMYEIRLRRGKMIRGELKQNDVNPVGSDGTWRANRESGNLKGHLYEERCSYPRMHGHFADFSARNALVEGRI